MLYAFEKIVFKKKSKDTKEQSEAVNDFSSITPGGI